jgi:hypothetical protein
MTRDHSFQSQIDLIFDSMDWNNIEKIFHVCDYKYMKNLHEEYNPEIEDLKEMSYHLLKDCYNLGKKKNINMIIASGRFEASWNNTDETLCLKFIPEEKEIMLDEKNESIYVT